MTATKNEKISDVKKPEKVAASPTSRPIIVTNHTMMTSDPMVVAATDDTKTTPEVGRTAVPSRSEKVIKPVSDMSTDATVEPETNEPAADDAEPSIATTKAPEQYVPPTTEPAVTKDDPVPADAEPSDSPVQKTSTESVAEVAEAVGDVPPEAALETPAPEPAGASPAAPVPAETAADESTDTAVQTEPKRDSAAAQASADAEAMAEQSEREQEIAGLIASGKYNVPINAVQRKRSRMHTSILLAVAMLSAFVLLDAALDAGLVTVPVAVPHTHFFSQQ